jgi:uncharacterized protein YndB with AHSA1/START domain
MNADKNNTSSDSEIINSRVCKASRTQVFSAFSNPNHLKNWWGPAGFTNTFNEFDFKVGGFWRFVMHGPDKGNYVNECEFTQIEEPSLIAWKRHSKPLFRVVFLFEEVADNQTRIIFKMQFDSVEECNKLKPYVIDKNEENFDKLEIELTKMN